MSQMFFHPRELRRHRLWGVLDHRRAKGSFSLLSPLGLRTTPQQHPSSRASTAQVLEQMEIYIYTCGFCFGYCWLTVSISFFLFFFFFSGQCFLISFSSVVWWRAEPQFQTTRGGGGRGAAAAIYPIPVFCSHPPNPKTNLIEESERERGARRCRYMHLLYESPTKPNGPSPWVREI